MYMSSLRLWSRGDWGLFQTLLRTLRACGDAHGHAPIAAVAARWVQARLDATCGGRVIMGVRDQRWLEETKAMTKLTLDSEDMRRIRDVLNQGAPPQGGVYSRERGR